MSSKLLPISLLTLLVALGCSASDTSLQRQGGPLPGEGGAGATGDAVLFCDALAVIRAKCQRCHGDPPAHGAPVPFLTYADTQAPYFDTKMKFTDVMLPAVQRDFMPYVALNDPPTSLMPPVEPLTAEEKTTLVGWLQQGALPQGGTDCPQ